jgi:cell division protease FtsH
MEQSRVTDLTYAPELKEKIAQGQVQSVEIGSDGHIEGKLKDGHPVRVVVPDQPPGRRVHQAPRRAQRRDQGVGPRTTLGSVLLSLLPLIVFVAIFVYLGRSARRQLAGDGRGSAGRGPRCSMLSGRRRPSRMWPAMRGPSGRSPRSSTS